MPQIVKKLKSLQEKCSFCRKRIQKKLTTAMGAVGASNNKRFLYIDGTKVKSH